MKNLLVVFLGVALGGCVPKPPAYRWKANLRDGPRQVRGATVHVHPTNQTCPPGDSRLRGLLCGRRRQGKSFLLRRLCKAHHGLYSMALEQERGPALQRFADTIATQLGLPRGALRFEDWTRALEAAFDALGRGRKARSPRLLVIDELPYLLAHSPELPSVIQELYDRLRSSSGPTLRLVLCGSALSVMLELLSGTRALRGRAVLDLCLRPFDFRQAARFWRAATPEIAFRVHAILGGTPGYRDLIDEALPRSPRRLGDWLAKSILNPSHALFNESDYLLREDPRVTDRALYHSILAAVSQGASRPSKIATLLGRDARALAHPLDVLRKAGFIEHDEDLLLQRNPILSVADPIVRFHHLITEQRLAAFEERRTKAAWDASLTTFSSQILGPHFEHLAREWVTRFASTEALDKPLGPVGTTVLNDPKGRAQHQVDVIALEAGETPRRGHPKVALLGEAKSSDRARRLTDLRRLEHIRALASSRGIRAESAQLVLFGRSGFDEALRSEARRRADVLLLDLATLYGRRAREPSSKRKRHGGSGP